VRGLDPPRLDMLIAEMHEANHRLGDALNKDTRVSKAARELDDEMKRA
jgi:hypothetical protein